MGQMIVPGLRRLERKVSIKVRTDRMLDIVRHTATTMYIK